MSETLQNQRQFNSQFEHQEIHRGKDMVKETRQVSLIIQVFVLVLTAITGYSMLKQPIFKISFVNETINFHQLRDTVTQIGNLNLGNIDQLQQSVDNHHYI